jgi:hypothetical protein
MLRPFLMLALQPCRQIGRAELEANILLDCARAESELLEYVTMALDMAENSGLVRSAADALLIFAMSCAELDLR